MLLITIYLFYTVIEVSLGEHGDHVYNMIKSIENGKQPKLINNTDQSKYVGGKILFY